MLAEDIHGVQMSIPVLNSQDKGGSTPLARAAEASRSSVLEELLKLPSIEINLPDNDGETPLHKLIRCSSKEKFRMITLLLGDDRTKAGLTDKRGRTPLWLAVKTGEGDIVKLLCERSDVKPDARDEKGRTPLWIAKYMRLARPDRAPERERIIEVLLATGRVNSNPLDKEGRSPDDVYSTEVCSRM
jgi:ankyrin repeat protein